MSSLDLKSGFGANAIRDQIKKESVLFGERRFSDGTRAIFDKFLKKK